MIILSDLTDHLFKVNDRFWPKADVRGLFRRTGDMPSDNDDERVMKNKQPLFSKDKKADSSDIERAVYDGMRDLRGDRSRELH